MLYREACSDRSFLLLPSLQHSKQHLPRIKGMVFLWKIRYKQAVLLLWLCIVVFAGIKSIFIDPMCTGLTLKRHYTPKHKYLWLLKFARKIICTLQFNVIGLCEQSVYLLFNINENLVMSWQSMLSNLFMKHGHIKSWYMSNEMFSHCVNN